MFKPVATGLGAIAAASVLSVVGVAQANSPSYSAALSAKVQCTHSGGYDGDVRITGYNQTSAPVAFTITASLMGQTKHYVFKAPTGGARTFDVGYTAHARLRLKVTAKGMAPLSGSLALPCAKTTFAN
jgi:hypothetical protein